jgi:hypothetical protein
MTMVRRGIQGAIAVSLMATAMACDGPGVETSDPGGAWRQAVADTILGVLADSERAYESGECNAAAYGWLPESTPLVQFAAEDQVIRLNTREEIDSYCEGLRGTRASISEQIELQDVKVLHRDAALVITRSVQTTEWRDGRTESQPTVETAVLAREGTTWRVIHKHISWR